MPNNLKCFIFLLAYLGQAPIVPMQRLQHGKQEIGSTNLCKWWIASVLQRGINHFDDKHP